MERFSKAEMGAAAAFLSSTIANCEKLQLKFADGTAQLSLLRNRIGALRIAKELLTDSPAPAFAEQDLRKALPPIDSIIHKTARAQSKYEAGSKQYKRFVPILHAMQIAKAVLEDRIGDDGQAVL